MISNPTMVNLTSKIKSMCRKHPSIYSGVSILLFSSVLLIMVAGNWTSLFSTFFSDNFVMLDGALRINYGQIPHLDFHTTLGALTFALPAITLKISNSFGPVVPIISILAFCFFVPVILYVLLFRFQPAITLLIAAYLMTLILVPMHIGAENLEFSLAMYYNRFCWVAITLLFMVYISPYNESKYLKIADAIVISLLLLLMFYMKITYAVVGFIFVTYMFVVKANYRRRILLAASIVASAMLLVEASLHFHKAYFLDIYDAIIASSAIRGGIAKPIANITNNADQIASLALAAFLLWKIIKPGYKTYLYFITTLTACILLLNQNAARYGLLALIAPLAVATEVIIRKEAGSAKSMGKGTAHVIMIFILLIFVSRPLLSRCGNLAYYSYKNFTQEETGTGNPLLNGIRFYKGKTFMSEFNWLYLEKMVDGTSWLQNKNTENCHLLTLQFSNPFSVTANLKPPRGDYAWFHYGRNISLKSYAPPSQVFDEVDIVMIPSTTNINKPSPDSLAKIYASFIKNNYKLYDSTSHWTVYTRKNNLTPECLCQFPESQQTIQ